MESELIYLPNLPIISNLSSNPNSPIVARQSHSNTGAGVVADRMQDVEIAGLSSQGEVGLGKGGVLIMRPQSWESTHYQRSHYGMRAPRTNWVP